MVQQETLSSPVQLASEGIQAIVGLLTEHETCKTTGSLALVFTLDRYANLVENFMPHFRTRTFSHLPSKAASVSSEGREVSSL